MESLINKAYKLFDTQEMNRNRDPHVHHNDQRRVDHDRGERSSQNSRNHQSFNSRVDHQSNSARQPVHRRFKSYTPLTVGRAQILNIIANEHYLRRSNPITHGPDVDKTKYCSFHKDYGHTTENCHKLKDEIEFHKRKGILKEYVRQGQPERRQDVGANGSKSLGKQPITVLSIW